MSPPTRCNVRRPAALTPALLLIVLVSCDGPISVPDHFEGQLDINDSYPTWLALGETIQFSASAWHRGEGYRVVPATWTSQDPSIATVDQSGLVQSVSVGRTAIAAEYGGFRDLASVTVSQNFTGTYLARLRVTSCEPVSGFPTSWCEANLGTVQTVQLDLRQTHDQVSGSWVFQNAIGTFPSSGMSTGNRTGAVTLVGASIPVADGTVSLVLRIETDDGHSLSGTFTERWQISGQPGSANIAGVVSGMRRDESEG